MPVHTEVSLIVEKTHSDNIFNPIDLFREYIKKEIDNMQNDDSLESNIQSFLENDSRFYLKRNLNEK